MVNSQHLSRHSWFPLFRLKNPSSVSSADQPSLCRGQSNSVPMMGLLGAPEQVELGRGGASVSFWFSNLCTHFDEGLGRGSAFPLLSALCLENGTIWGVEGRAWFSGLALKCAEATQWVVKSIDFSLWWTWHPGLVLSVSMWPWAGHQTSLNFTMIISSTGPLECHGDRVGWYKQHSIVSDDRRWCLLKVNCYGDEIGKWCSKACFSPFMRRGWGVTSGHLEQRGSEFIHSAYTHSFCSLKEFSVW